MPFRELTYHYHDALLERFELSDERELTLDIRLDPVSNRNGPERVRLRFGGIRNVDHVRIFFTRVSETPRHPEALAEIIDINCPDAGKWVVDLARHGAVTIATHQMPQDQ